MAHKYVVAGLLSKKYWIYSMLAIMTLSLSARAEKAPLDGEQIYKQNCMICHGADGSGFMPGVPDLSESTGWKTMPIKDLLGRVKNGVQTPGAAISMPPKGGNADLTDGQLEAALVYMRKNIP